MSKFIIENILIEKSSRDIKTNQKYAFSDGINIISGRNEAGKSSLMSFINDGFQKKDKNPCKGKIFFKIEDENSTTSYRADIDFSKKKEKRIIIFDENNQDVSSSILDKHIDLKYLKHGFIINLDNLMSITDKENESLANIIKDPSGNDLNNYLNIIKNNTKKIFGNNNALVGDTNKILSEINSLNCEISSLSEKETEYNNALIEIKNLSEKLSLINKQEEYLNILENIKKETSELDLALEGYQKEKVNFNSKLFENQKKYMELNDKFALYPGNIEAVNNLKKKEDDLNIKIADGIKRLNIEFALNMTEKEIFDFVVNYESIKQIKDISEEINKTQNDINNTNLALTNIKEKLNQLKSDLNRNESRMVSEEEFSELKKLYKFFDEGIKFYNHLLSEISQKDDSAKNNDNLMKKINYICIFILILSLIAAIVSFYLNGIISGIILLCAAAVTVYSTAIIKNFNKQDEEKERLLQHKNSIISELKTKLSQYNNENPDNYNIIIKAESEKQELYNKIQNYEKTLDEILKVKDEIERNNEKFDLNIKNNNILENKINSLHKQIDEIIKRDNSDFKINSADFPQIVEIITSIKNNLLEKYNCEKEIKKTENDNEFIKKELSDFISDNSIFIQLSEITQENIKNLKDYNNQNNEIKRKMDIKEVQIEQFKNRISEYQNKLPEIQEDLKLSLEEIHLEKERIIEQKKQAEYSKYTIEAFEGLGELKLKRNIKLEEFRKKIFELLKNKMILELSEKAKKNFDKNLPDLINAQKFLSLLTDGKYTKINLDSQEIQNEEGTVIKNWNELSRGTKEQLYLALRLGYASNYTKDKNTGLDNQRAALPLIIDDAFVNFDFVRTQNALKCLEEFSKTNQVLFFTCHLNTSQEHCKTLKIAENINFIDILAP